MKTCLQPGYFLMPSPSNNIINHIENAMILFAFLLSIVCGFIWATVPHTQSDFLLYILCIQLSVLLLFLILLIQEGIVSVNRLSARQQLLNKMFFDVHITGTRIATELHISIKWYFDFSLIYDCTSSFLWSSCEDQGGCCTRYNYYVLYIYTYTGTLLVLSPS